MANLQENTEALQEALATLRTKSLPSAEPTLQDKTVTPSNETLIITADSGYDGLNEVTVVGDSNLAPENIKSGVSIFGVDGGYEGSGSSGGGSVETYTGTITAVLSPDLDLYTVVYTDKDLNIQSVSAPSSPFNFEVVKNSIVYIQGGACNTVSGCERLGGGTGSYAYKITANNFSLSAT